MIKTMRDNFFCVLFVFKKIIFKVSFILFTVFINYSLFKNSNFFFRYFFNQLIASIKFEKLL